MYSQLLSPTLHRALLLGTLMSIVSTGLMPAIAQARRYSPTGGQPPRSGQLGGTRSNSCTGDTDTPFTALAPFSHVGQTTATHPTFAWYVPDSEPLAVDFRLYIYGEGERLQPQPVYATVLPTTQGVMALTLPLTEPGLIPGQQYYWQIALICDPNHRSEDLIVNADLKLVENTIPESERWYDLLEDDLTDNGISLTSITELLTDLADLESSAADTLAQSIDTAPEADRPRLVEHRQEVLQHSTHLKQIVEAAP